MPPLIPIGFRVVPDPDTRVGAAGTTVWGGTPWRLLRLSVAGAEVARALLDGQPVTGVAAGALARRLVESGLVAPVPPAGVEPPEIEVVVPAHDRPAALARCLTALSGLRVTVIDDGSLDPAAVATVTAAHGARLIRLASNRGPAAARNAGRSAADADVVAFVDSDCTVDASTLRRLSRHLADPLVAAAAPRVRPRPSYDGAPRVLTRFVEHRSPLDMGARSAPVRADGRVSYVPTAAIVVRRAAVDAVGGFDESLRYGEDVDLVWRLTDAGWSVRYDATCEAWHEEPERWSELLRRRVRYGSSAGPLARRHGERMAGPSPVGLLAPLRLGDMRRAGLPLPAAVRVAAVAPLRTAQGLLRWGAPLWCPPLTAAPALLEWAGRRPRLDPLRWVAACVVDDAAYGAGVWRGCVGVRSLTPLRLRRRSAGDGGSRSHDDPRLQTGAQPAQHFEQSRLSDGDATRGGAVV